MTDIVERLHRMAPDYEIAKWAKLMQEAANEIERLNALVAKMADDLTVAGVRVLVIKERYEELRAENKRLQAALIEAAEMVEK
jgi:hypothetical protein